jgi:excinuclease ABC subunit C
MASPEYVLSLPQLPGIYVFKDGEGAIIYVGKAKQLKNRVSSYFRKQDDWKVQELIKEHSTIEHILTKNELEALLLEAHLIRTYKPKYNVLLKNSNPFVYLAITAGDPPLLQLVRQKKGKGTFFGPFLYKKRARSSYEYLMRSLKLNLCSTKIEQGCLDYHMGLCAGNCRPSFNKDEYLVRLMIAQRLLEGNYAACQEMLIKQIREHNERLEFEKSKRLSIYLNDLASLFEALQTGFTERKYQKDITVMSTPISTRIEKPIEALFELQKLLMLPERPETIDCFDISHFQSSYLVGSCIRFNEGVPEKNKFRRFKIKTLTEQNDYAALQEIVSRRYRDPDELPHIVLIDGGKGQLSSVKHLLPNALCISLAKREELLHTPLHAEGIPLDIKTPLGQLLMGLRDYAHHFAISYHRVLRSKNFLPNTGHDKRKISL